MSKLKVFLVDDHKMFREGLQLLLNNHEGIDQVWEAPDGESFLADLENHQPDIVFMDISMPGLDGIETTRRALKQHPDLNIVALSMYGDENYYSPMIEA